MNQILDYAFIRPSPAQIKALGYIGVMRYLAPSIDAAKRITPAEYKALLTAELKVGLNWEWYDVRPREGAPAGRADAQAALVQSNALGYKGAIYFSVDFDATEADQVPINAYMEACAAVIGKARLGAYGGYWVIKRLFDAGLISFGWQAIAWSGKNRERRAHLFQNGGHVFGTGADINDVWRDDWQGITPAPAPKPTPKGQKGSMLLQHPTNAARLDVVYVGTDGNVYHAHNNNDGALGLAKADVVQHSLGKPTQEALLSVEGTWSPSGSSINIIAVGASGQLYVTAVNLGDASEMVWSVIPRQIAAVPAAASGEPEAAKIAAALQAGLAAVEAGLS